MSALTAKQKILQAIERLPDDTSLEDAIVIRWGSLLDFAPDPPSCDIP